MEIKPHSFLTLALDKGKWLASRSGSFISVDGAPDILEMGAGWDPELSRRVWGREICRVVSGFDARIVELALNKRLQKQEKYFA